MGRLGASPEGGRRVSGALLGPLPGAGVSGWRGSLTKVRLLEAGASASIEDTQGPHSSTEATRCQPDGSMGPQDLGLPGAGYTGRRMQKGKRGGLTWVGAGGNGWGSWRLMGAGQEGQAPESGHTGHMGGGAGGKGQGLEHWGVGCTGVGMCKCQSPLGADKLFLLREWHVGSESAPCPPEDKPGICPVDTGPPLTLPLQQLLHTHNPDPRLR